MPAVSRRICCLGLAAAGLGAAPLGGAVLRIDETALGLARDRAAGIDQLHSLSVAVAGERVLAEAFRGPKLTTPVNVKSVSKTLLATLALIAIDKGFLPGPDAPMLPLLGRYAPQSVAPGAEGITVGHLMSMQSGLVRTSGGAYGDWVTSPNWIHYILTRPLVARPGQRMSYSTGDFHLLSAVLTAVTGQSTHSLARDWLAAPLGIAIPPWTRDPQGVFMGGNNMAISAEAMVRFGEMARAGGLYLGQRVVSSTLQTAAWTARGRSPFSGDAYGYGWFLAKFGWDDVYYARGYGGQMIYVVPSRQTVVAITSDPSRPARRTGHGGVLNQLVARDILPAIAQG